MSEKKKRTKTEKKTVKKTEKSVARKPKKSSENAMDAQKKEKIILAVSITIVCILAVAIGVYLYYGYQHKDEFFKGTTINGMDVGGMTVEEVEAIFADTASTYKITVTAKEGKSVEINAADIDYHFVSDGSVQKISDEQIWWQWVIGYLMQGHGNHEATVPIAYDKETLKAVMNSWDFMNKDNWVAPVDSVLTYEENQYVVTDHVDGNTIDENILLDALVAAIDSGADALNVEETGAYVMPTVTSDDEVLNANAKTLNDQANCTITYNMPDGTTKVINKDLLLTWMSTDETGRYYRDDAVFNEKIAAFVQEINTVIESCNGSKVTFNSSNSGNPRQISVRSYLSGAWVLNVEEETAQLTEEIYSNTTTTREPVYSARRFQGSGPLGDTYVEIDMSAQHLWYYEGGTLQLECDIVSGTYTDTSRRTPEGIYSLDYKQEDRVLRGPKVKVVTEVKVPVEVTVPGTDPVLDEEGNVITEGTPPTTKIEYKTEQKEEEKYEYEQPVDYWMPFNGGIGMHDAGWRGSFGGTIYKYSGSHGCINMPHSKAAELYSMIEKGCTVVCYY